MLQRGQVLKMPISLNTAIPVSWRNVVQQWKKKPYQVLGELLYELQSPEEQGGPIDILCVLSAMGIEDTLFSFCPCRPEVPADTQALYAQTFC